VGDTGPDPVERAVVAAPGLGRLRPVARIRPFRRLWLVLGLSSLGDWLGLLAIALFASAQEAMAPKTCATAAATAAFRRHAASIASDQAVAGQLLALAQPEATGWPAVAQELRQMAGAAPRGIGPEATIDYEVCVFIHAFRTVHPAAAWSREERRRAGHWADRARAELSKVSSA
jgi:hypothetical protein